MKKVYNNNPKTRKYLDSLPKYYLIARWGAWGVREFPFSGKYYRDYDGVDIPLVYMYNDHNGTCDQYELIRIDYTTTGFIAGWTQLRSLADKIALHFNQNKE